MNEICKLCTNYVQISDYFDLSGPSFVSKDLQFKDLLHSCFPDMDLPNSGPVCRNCTSALHISYNFRTTVLDTILPTESTETDQADMLVEEEEEDETSSEAAPKITNKRVCHICGKHLSGASTLSIHMKIHTGMKAYLCELCGKHFRARSMLELHQRIHAKEKSFKCNECDYTATRKAHIQSHMKTHTHVNVLNECFVCGNRYASKVLLYKHQKDHA